MQTNEKISPTAYDDAYRTLLEKCSEFMFPVLYELFGEEFSGDEQIELNQNELFIRKPDGSAVERITDSSFRVKGSQTARHYHVECQSSPNETMLLRIFEYDAQLALDHSRLNGNKLTVAFPRTALIYLRSSAETPDELLLEIKAPNGQIVVYSVPVLKTQGYGLEELFHKKLFFLLPFYGFCHEKDLPGLERDEEKRQKLVNEYRGMRARLDELCEAGQLNEYQKYELIHTAELVLNKLMFNFPKTKQEVKNVMGGRVIESEADRILQRGERLGEQRGEMRGEQRGMKKGIQQGMREGMQQGMREGRQQGMKQGIQQAIHDSIANMLKSGKTPEQIADFCGYELEEVRSVEEELLQKA